MSINRPTSSVSPLLVSFFGLIALVLIGYIVTRMFFLGIERVPPGYVAVQTHLVGSNKGVDNVVVKTGRFHYNKWTEQVNLIQTTDKTYVFTTTKDKDESFSFGSIEGQKFSADLSLTLHVDPAKVPIFYVQYRMEPEEIAHTYIHNAIRDALNNVAGTMKAEDIYGAKKEQLLDEVKKRVNAQFEPLGLTIKTLGFTEALTPPPAIEEAINNKLSEQQKAQQAEYALQTKQAEAQQAVAVAQGKADAEVAEAKGEAQAQLIKAQAEAQANKIIVESVGGYENYIRLQAIEQLNPKVQTMVVPSDSNQYVGIPGFAPLPSNS